MTVMDTGNDMVVTASALRLAYRRDVDAIFEQMDKDKEIYALLDRMGNLLDRVEQYHDMAARREIELIKKKLYKKKLGRKLQRVFDYYEAIRIAYLSGQYIDSRLLDSSYSKVVMKSAGQNTQKGYSSIEYRIKE